MTTLNQLAELGQSVWLDYIRRSFLADGSLADLIDQGVRGVTSNPTIFEKAITGSSDYDDELKVLVADDKSIDEIYETLVLADIQNAADILRPVFDSSDGVDGYVSLEVSPTLANDTDGTIAEARRLFAALDRPNVMIKVPATPGGVPAIQTLIGDGININVTLIFSVSQYEAVVEAYISGLEKLAADGGDVSKVASVASFFVSRVDGKVDKALADVGNTALPGKIAIANAKIAYARFQELFSGARWESLAAKNASVQRPLWASTSTKNPSYLDTLYVDTLIGAHTVNTMPPETLNAALDHATVAVTVTENLDGAREQLSTLANLGIDLEAITDDLQTEGVDKFAASFESLMNGIQEKRARLQQEMQSLTFSLGDAQAKVNVALSEMKNDDIMTRIWRGDHTVWQDDPTEITNRVGWLTIADRVDDELHLLDNLVSDVKADGYTDVLLLGMGGSSLAPEVFQRTFGNADGHPKLAVLDSTDPGAVLREADRLDLSKTLFIVATKSGGTAETLSFFKYFYNLTLEKLGADEVGRHFVAITDPGSKLVALAEQFNFRTTFINDPNIGGRYSALSYFGLVPAAMIGVDVPKLLDRAKTAAVNCDQHNCPEVGDNHGAQIGAAMGELAKIGRDKLTFIISPAFESFGDWVEQLIAESTGKQGVGILPVVGEPVSQPSDYGDDRLFVYIQLADDDTHTASVDALKDAGQPVIHLQLDDVYDLGGQFFTWEMATAVAGYRLDINPFDQPNVESAKVVARQMIAAYQESGELPTLESLLTDDGITVYGDVSASTPQDALAAFLATAKDGAYVALHAYVPSSPEMDAALTGLRLAIRSKTNMATTSGYGPRFLHSTGQLHKGDAGKGLFIQFTATMPRDADIPDDAGKAESGMTFGTLKLAQALGDRQALLDEGRAVIRFDLGDDALAAIKSLTAAL